MSVLAVAEQKKRSGLVELLAKLRKEDEDEDDEETG